MRDIRLGIEELRVSGGSRAPPLFLDIVEDQDEKNEEPYVCPLPPRARLLVDAVARLLGSYDRATQAPSN